MMIVQGTQAISKWRALYTYHRPAKGDAKFFTAIVTSTYPHCAKRRGEGVKGDEVGCGEMRLDAMRGGREH